MATGGRTDRLGDCMRHFADMRKPLKNIFEQFKKVTDMPNLCAKRACSDRA